MAKALIVYASMTGNTEEIADIMTHALIDLGIEAQMRQCEEAYAGDFTAYDLCIVATYTYGTDGDLPDEIVDFYEELADVDLSGKVFATLGSGDTFYARFCQAVDDFTEQFKLTGARQAGPAVKVDLEAQADDIANIEALAKQCQVALAQ